MGRNKFSASEIEEIARLLRLKNAGNRYKQKLVRHKLRVDYGFNISDFGVQGKAFGEDDLREAVHRHAIEILDDATIASMRERYESERKARAEAARAAQEAAPADPASDWHKALEQWNAEHPEEKNTETE